MMWPCTYITFLYKKKAIMFRVVNIQIITIIIIIILFKQNANKYYESLFIIRNFRRYVMSFVHSGEVIHRANV